MNKQATNQIIDNLNLYTMCNFVLEEEEEHRFEHRDNLMFAMENIKIWLKEQFGIIRKKQLTTKKELVE